MKKIIIYTMILIGLTTIGCKKSTGPALSNFTGAATLTTPLAPNAPAVPMANQKITLTNVRSGASYDLLTDALGVFSFPGVSASDQYKISLTLMVTDANQFQAVYDAAPTISGGQADISKYALSAVLDVTAYKGLLITVTDKSGGAVPGAKVIVYTSGELAKLDPDFQGYGSLCSVTSNASGLCLAMQLPPTVFVQCIFLSADGKVKLQSALQTIPVDSYKPLSIVVQ